MNTEWKQKWVAALRSGEYKKGTRGLRSPNSEGGYNYCCLGVLCNLINPNAWRHSVFSPGNDFEERLSYVPDKISEEIGLSDDYQHELARLNDSGYSFAEIAEVIEREL
jgi:hypothetical protein